MSYQLSQIELEHTFEEINDFSVELYFNFEDVFNTLTQNIETLTEDEMPAINLFKKTIESTMKNKIEEVIPDFKSTPLAQGFKLPITHDNFEFNILNILANFKERIHNKINTKAKRNG